MPQLLSFSIMAFSSSFLLSFQSCLILAFFSAGIGHGSPRSNSTSDGSMPQLLSFLTISFSSSFLSFHPSLILAFFSLGMGQGSPRSNSTSDVSMPQLLSFLIIGFSSSFLFFQSSLILAFFSFFGIGQPILRSSVGESSSMAQLDEAALMKLAEALFGPEPYPIFTFILPSVLGNGHGMSMFMSSASISSPQLPLFLMVILPTPFSPSALATLAALISFPTGTISIDNLFVGNLLNSENL